MQPQVLTTPYAEYKIENGILIVTYANNLVISLEIAKQLAADRIRFSNSITTPILIDIRGLASVDTISRKFLADSSQYVSAGALLVESLISKLAGNIFITVDKPSVPTRLFTDREKALRWLAKFK